MLLTELLQTAFDRKASDVHLKVGSIPVLRINGVLERFDGKPPLTTEAMDEILNAIMSPQNLETFRQELELDLRYELEGQAYFRVNASHCEGQVRVVFRIIPHKIPDIDSLGLPPVVHSICGYRDGLVIVTGPTGVGKSTTLAAMIDKINTNLSRHIVTIEDPIEFVHHDKKGIITQRQVGIDTHSFGSALRSVLRQDPDVILIGEMRDFETVASAMTAAETGHLVFSTLHTIDALETLNRVIDFFPANHQVQMRKQFASVLRGIISQRLLPKKDGAGRIPAIEVLIGSVTVREIIDKGSDLREIVKLMQDGKSAYGMQTFDMALFDLHKAGLISEEEALRNATSPKDLKLKIQGMVSSSYV